MLFLVDHLGFSRMIGLFGDVNGTIVFDAASPAASKLNVDVKTASQQPQFGPRDADPKGAEWFNVVEFPEMTFVGKTKAKREDKTGEVTGDLTLLGVSKPVRQGGCGGLFRPWFDQPLGLRHEDLHSLHQRRG